MNHRRRASSVALISTLLVQLTACLCLLGNPFRTCGVEISGEYLTDVWTADDGMPDSSVTAIAQTPDGYLWVGTYNGLVRFDGVRFVTFDPANIPALAHARVRKLSVDDQGTLWINTFDGSMTSLRQGFFAREWTRAEGLDPDATLVLSTSNQVTFLMHRGFLRRKLLSAPTGTGWEDLYPTNRSVGAFCLADGTGTIWYRGSDKHLSRVTGNAFVPLPPACGLASSQINCLTTDPQGYLWVATDQEIARWDGNRFETITPTNGELPTAVVFLSVAKDGRWWTGAGGKVRAAMDRRWVLETELHADRFASNPNRLGACEDHRGGVWLFSYGGGLSHVASGGQVRQFSPQAGFPGERVNCFFEDHEGNWWAGLDAAGLVRIRERRFQIIDPGGQMPMKPARSVCEETNGTLWIGTLGDGLARWQSGQFTNLTVPGGTEKGFAFCVCPDAAGRLWLSAGDEDLFVREQSEFKRLAPVIHGVKAIFADPAGRVWVGTKSGLYFADRETAHDFKLYGGIGRHDVRALSADGHGNLWVGTEDGSLFRITGDSVATFHPTDAAASPAIWSLLAEADGTVWAGTFRGGLLRWRDGKFSRFSLGEGLPDNIICQILPDGAGNLWLGSHRGLIRVATSSLHEFARGHNQALIVTTFGRSDGLPSLECSGGYQPAAWRGHDGRLWFTTLKGAVSVRPEDLRTNLVAPPVVIEELLIDGKSLDSTTTLEKPLADGTVTQLGGKTVEVPPGKHQVEFRYTGLSLVSPDRVQFRYRLEGADPQWIEAGTRRSVQYNLLPPGTYRFCVLAANSDLVWNETGEALTLKILPYFYETAWFHLLASLALVVLVAGAVRYSVTRRLHRKLEQFARQQAVERERARIAKDIHDDLGANLTLIARLGDLAKREKTIERIDRMASTARQAVKSLDEIVWAVNPRNDTLAHLIDYTGQFATDYLHAAGVDCLLDVPENVPRREVLANIRHNMFLVVKEALQNIIKHAQASEVWLRVQVTTQELRIVVEDNGRGFTHAPDDALADGLRNMRQRMSEAGGQCLIQTQPGAGTKIILEMPWSAG